MYQNKNFTWRSEWISEYESIWGIIEKFRYSNNLSISDIVKIFGKESSKKKLYNLPLIKSGQSFGIKHLNEEKIIDILGVNILKQFEEKMKIIVNDIPVNFDLVRKELYYCPECIRYGYHSFLFQIGFINYCPYHNIKLFHFCPNCKKEINYNEVIEISEEPFRCRCGHYFYDTNVGYNFIFNWSFSPDIQLANILKYLTYNEYQKDSLRLLYFDRLYINNFHKNNYLYFLDTIANNNLSENHFKVVFNSFLKNSVCKLSIDNKLEKNPDRNLLESRLINNNLKKVYKSFSIYLRHRLLYRHKGCINSLKNNGILLGHVEFDICPLAYAYVVWCNIIEGRESFSAVCNDWQNRNNSSIYTQNQSNMLNKILENISENSKLNYNQKFLTAEWLMGRAFYLSIYDLFLMLLTNCDQLIKEHAFYRGTLDFNKYYKRIFAVKLPDLHVNYFEFHWWESFEGMYKEIIKDIKCPFNDKGKKKNNKLKRSYTGYNIFQKLP